MLFFLLARRKHKSKQNNGVKSLLELVFYSLHTGFLQMDAEDRNEIIKMYFNMGMLYKDIVRILAVDHHVILTLRHLKRI